jgi:hypothetical protein
MDENETIMRRWFSEVWNKGDVSTIDDLLEPSAVVGGLLPDQKHEGREKFKEFHKLTHGFTTVVKLQAHDPA